MKINNIIFYFKIIYLISINNIFLFFQTTNNLKNSQKVKFDNKEIFPEEPKKEEKLKLKEPKAKNKEESNPENCDRDVRLGKKGEFGVFPFISFPGSGNT